MKGGSDLCYAIYAEGIVTFVTMNNMSEGKN